MSYAPNTRETIRDDAVKFFLEEGLLIKNPDNPSRPTTSAKTVYQIEPAALKLLRTFGSPQWVSCAKKYLKSREHIKKEINRTRDSFRIPVKLDQNNSTSLSPGGQNPLIKAIVEDFRPEFIPDGKVLYIGDTETKFLHLDSEGLKKLGIILDPASKIPDVIIYSPSKNWLLLVEAVASEGLVDGKRRS